MHLYCPCSSQDKDLGAAPRVLALGDEWSPKTTTYSAQTGAGRSLFILLQALASPGDAS